VLFGIFFVKKNLQKDFNRYIMVNMNENRTTFSSIQAAVSLNLLLLRRKAQ